MSKAGRDEGFFAGNATNGTGWDFTWLTKMDFGDFNQTVMDWMKLMSMSNDKQRVEYIMANK